MDVREKLVELLQDENDPVWMWFPNNASMMQLSDYLIANGVTVQEDCKDCAEATQNCIVKLQEQISELRSAHEWIPVTERLPEPKHEFDARNWYLVALSNGVVKELAYEFNNNSVFGYGWRETAYPVTHWMPMPHPPKGE